MNVYDFDETIYDGDSTVDFYKYCLRRRPYIIFRFPLWTALRFVLDSGKKLVFKERFYRFLYAFDDIDSEVSRFWDGHEKKIKRWYLENRRPDDVVISASPEFLLNPVCKRLGISVLMASVVDKKRGFIPAITAGEGKGAPFFMSGLRTAKSTTFIPTPIRTHRLQGYLRELLL